MRDNAEQDTDDPRDIGEVANELFLLHMAQYMYWKDPTEGAVSPALSTFFSFCNPEVPALVHWARWLRIDHEADDGIDILSLPLAEELVEAMIEGSDRSHDRGRHAARRAW
jgi:hypothetical protein